MKEIDDESVEKKLLITRTICQHNVDEYTKSVVEIRNKLQRLEKELAECRDSLAEVEEQLNNFYGQQSRNSKFYKKRL